MSEESYGRMSRKLIYITQADQDRASEMGPDDAFTILVTVPNQITDSIRRWYEEEKPDLDKGDDDLGVVEFMLGDLCLDLLAKFAMRMDGVSEKDMRILWNEVTLGYSRRLPLRRRIANHLRRWLPSRSGMR